ncbi:MAG: glycerate kinase [Propionicimonas sp.]|nr:glycerate kinase [Propionicimonas sp.]
MRKVILIPDSFKGTLSSTELCEAMAAVIVARRPGAEVVALPVADGGEGSVAAFLAAVGGDRVPVSVTGPFAGEQVESFYGRLDDTTAVVEMAAAAGLPLAEGRLAPDLTTTYGVGELMLAAATAGATRLVIGAGGSATNDLGTGAAAAAGVRFTDAAGTAFVPTGGTLDRIAGIDASGLAPELAACEVTVMCDIDNPLYGSRGAAHVFGPQKGADAAMVELLDRQLRAGAAAIARDLGVEVADVPGAGAAGGLGAGLLAFFGATLRQGIDVVLDAVGFDHQLTGADLVITGEGRLDAQSLSGKVVVGVARRASSRGVPVVAVVGQVGEGYEAVFDLGVTRVEATSPPGRPFSQARLTAREDLIATMERLLDTL